MIQEADCSSINKKGRGTNPWAMQFMCCRAVGQNAEPQICVASATWVAGKDAL